MNLRLIKIIPFLFFGISVYPNSVSSDKLTLKEAQNILDALYQASGHFTFTKPTIKIAPENANVAAYHPAENQITIDAKAMTICESMGMESKNALAFLIGHELAHALQKEVRHRQEPTNFLAYDKHYHATERTEKVADIQGVFTGYLAGYGMQKAIPVFLELVYEAYNLKDKSLPNYPSFAERTASAVEVIGIVENLKDLFEINPCLLLYEEYNLAIVSLEYIHEYYQGFEIKNNLGVAYMLLAMDFLDEATDKFAFPLMMDFSSQLEKVDLTRAPLSMTERMFRNTILRQSINYFESAIQLNTKHVKSKINKACALNMLGDHNGAFQYLMSDQFSTTEKKDAEFQLALGITEALLKHFPAASRIFNDLKNSDQPGIPLFADFNDAILKNNNNEHFKNAPVVLPDPILSMAESYQLGKTQSWNAISISSTEDFSFRSQKEKGRSSYSFGEGFNNYISFIVLQPPHKTTLPASLLSKQRNFSTIDNRFFLMDTSAGVIVICDEEGVVSEIIKVFEH